MKFVDNYLDKILDRLSVQQKQQLNQGLKSLKSVYPFNKYEYTIAHLIGNKQMSLDEYLDLRAQHLKNNPYLHLFEQSSPRGFGEAWAQKHLKQLVPDLMMPQKTIDPNYSGQYDLLYKSSKDQYVRIEVKASRAVDSDSREPLYIKALSWKSARPFDMNFQQIKPHCCDVFVWIGVWRDRIQYWVLAAQEVQKNCHYSKGQHRGSTGEGQLHLKHDNIESFKAFVVPPHNLLNAIKKAYQREP